MATDDNALTAPVDSSGGPDIPGAVMNIIAPPHEPGDGPPRSVPHWTGWLLVGLGLVTLPWIAGLAEVLPTKSIAAHYDVSWVGFDILLCAMLLRTGWALLRDRRYVEITAAMTSVLLVVDSWFDVITSPTVREFEVALVMAVVVQLPLATFCLWVAGRVEFEQNRRIRIMAETLRRLTRRRDRLADPGPRRWKAQGLATGRKGHSSEG